MVLIFQRALTQSVPHTQELRNNSLRSEGSENLAFCNLLGVGRRHEIPGFREKKDFIIHGTVGSLSFMFVLISHAPSCSMGTTQRGSVQADATRTMWVCVKLRNLVCREPESFLMGCLEACLIFFLGNTLSLLYWTIDKTVLSSGER